MSLSDLTMCYLIWKSVQTTLLLIKKNVDIKFSLTTRLLLIGDYKLFTFLSVDMEILTP